MQTGYLLEENGNEQKNKKIDFSHAFSKKYTFLIEIKFIPCNRVKFPLSNGTIYEYWFLAYENFLGI